MNVGENIKIFRTRKDLTQEELAEKIGVSRSMVAQFERGSRAVVLPIAKELAEIFGCTVEDLMK